MLCLVQYVKVIVICARESAALCTTLRHSRDRDQGCAHVGETGAPHPGQNPLVFHRTCGFCSVDVAPAGRRLCQTDKRGQSRPTLGSVRRPSLITLLLSNVASSPTRNAYSKIKLPEESGPLQPPAGQGNTLMSWLPGFSSHTNARILYSRPNHILTRDQSSLWLALGILHLIPGAFLTPISVAYGAHL